MAKRSCKKGYYYCFTSEKCKKIPKGWHLMSSTGRIMKDSEHKEEEETKKNGNGTNGNGSGNGDSSGGSDGGGVSEGWSAKYKKSIDCDNPKGFSQRAHCQGRKKVNEEKKEGCDHEVVMARKQVKKSMDNLKKLARVLAKKSECDDIPAWVQAKITDTEHNTDAASSYMEEGKRDGKSPKDKGYSLRDWFAGGGWVQAGGKYDGKPCAKQPGQKTKPFCRDADDRASMSKKERSRRAAKKRKEDPNPNRKGKAKMVSASYSNWRNELEDLHEIPAIVALPLVAGGAYAAYKGLKHLKKKGDEALDNARQNATLNNTPFGAGARQRAIEAGSGVKPGYLNPNMQRLRNSYEFEGELVENNVVKTKGGASDRIDIEFKGGTKQTIIPGKTKITSPGARPRPKLFGVDTSGLEGPKNPLGEEKDACYKKVKSRYKIWPSAYASGALVKCREVGAANWGNKTKKESYEFSNWRDEFYPSDVETVNIIEPQPLQPSKGIGSEILGEKKDPCWDGYTQKGMKKKGGKMVPNCVKEGYSNWREELAESGYDSTRGRGEGRYQPTEYLKVNPKKYEDDMKWWRENLKNAPPVRQASTKKTTQVAHFEPEGELIEDWQKVNKDDKTDGMSQKAVNAYRRENPGSKLKTAVTEKKPKGKRAKRRKSFCARSKGQKDMHNIDCTKTPDKAICKARKRWRC